MHAPLLGRFITFYFSSQLRLGQQKYKLLIWSANPINKNQELLYRSRCFCGLPPTERLKILRSSHRAPFPERSHCLVAPSQPLNSAVSPRWRCTEQTGHSSNGVAMHWTGGSCAISQLWDSGLYCLKKKCTIMHHPSLSLVINLVSWVVVNAKTKCKI